MKGKLLIKEIGQQKCKCPRHAMEGQQLPLPYGFPHCYTRYNDSFSLLCESWPISTASLFKLFQ